MCLHIQEVAVSHLLSFYVLSLQTALRTALHLYKQAYLNLLNLIFYFCQIMHSLLFYIMLMQMVQVKLFYHDPVTMLQNSNFYKEKSLMNTISLSILQFKRMDLKVIPKLKAYHQRHLIQDN